jgi:hypothetical protein
MESKGNVVMSRTRKMLAGMFIMLSLVGVGGAGQSASAAADAQVSATRWCC